MSTSTFYYLDNDWNQVTFEQTLHLDPIYTCRICKLAFDHLLHFRYHQCKPPTEKPHTCTYCNKAFFQKAHLTVHMRTHNNDKPFQCNYCKKSFTQKGNLVTHIRIHTGEKPYQCNQCSKSFTQKSNLNLHILKHNIHPNQTTEETQNDDTSFAPKTSLLAQTPSHSDKKEFKCQSCGKCYALKIALNKHVCEKKVQLVTYKCEVCNRQFIRQRDLHKHLARVNYHRD